MSHRDEQPGRGINRPDGPLDQLPSSPAELGTAATLADAPSDDAESVGQRAPRNSETVHNDAASTPATADGGRAIRYRISGKLVTLFLAAMIIVACMGDGFLWWNNRGDSQTQAAETAAKAAANDSVPLLLSYNYVDLDRYAARATSKTTGPFADDLKKLLDTQVLPAARAKSIATQTTVQGTATTTASAHTVVLLMFIDQTTRMADIAAPKIEGARLEVTMTNQDGRWLISGLKPI